RKARPPMLLMYVTVSLPVSGLISATTTAAPSRANTVAIARPMPWPPPVTITVFSSNSTCTSRCARRRLLPGGPRERQRPEFHLVERKDRTGYSPEGQCTKIRAAASRAVDADEAFGNRLVLQAGPQW